MTDLYSRHVTGNNGKRYVLTDRQKIAYHWLPRGGIIADIGSSVGPIVGALAAQGNTVIAVDVDREALTSLKQHLNNALPTEASASRLPLKTESLDAILLLDVLEHVADEHCVIQEIHRTLRPGGTLILSVPNKGIFRFLDPQNLAARVKGTYTQKTEHRHYSFEELQSLLLPHFQIVKKKYGGLFIYPMTFYLTHFFKKYFHVDWGRRLSAIGDMDNDISWGRWSYNVILMLVKR
jgi:2-polyprenyl-3-methyl-5-hydroxy-6-metoxy-1,4-benzoquinol methylase